MPIQAPTFQWAVALETIAIIVFAIVYFVHTSITDDFGLREGDSWSTAQNALYLSVGYMSGMSSKTFEPQTASSRAEVMVQCLVRIVLLAWYVLPA